MCLCVNIFVFEKNVCLCVNNKIHSILDLGAEMCGDLLLVPDFFPSIETPPTHTHMDKD